MPIIVTSDLLINQIKRESLAIAESFDILCDDDLNEISDLYSQAAFVLISALNGQRPLSNVQSWAVEVLINISISLSAAVYVLRAGYLLVPGTVLRNAVEAMAVCLHGLQNSSDLKKIQSGEFNTPHAITTAKKIIPPFGQIYGMLSNLFTHISPLHQKIKPLAPYTEQHAGLDMNLKTIRASIWLFYVVVEFAFIGSLGESARYWKIVSPNSGKYDPSEEERAWLATY
ncbi:hypothetical protein [Quatrionicoccus australiensis]|uniref:hypothetical protein n=1 Tax=Quatrionicoccus australiensis TaxID=138118 RepID=UPI001CF82A58|nr:hypothetical protein [Quatrionicoccus australiensis]UCV16528.1 hypothetical protein KI612_07465 [Quatrionicoccus australiensis]